MINTSNRVDNLIDSPIRHLSNVEQYAKKQGVKIYKLNIGQPDIPTPTVFLESIHQANPQLIRYSPSQGELPLRQELAKHYNSFYNTTISEEQVHVTYGSSEALLFIFFACADEDEEIITVDPCYTNYVGYAQMINIRLTSVNSNIEDGYKLPSISDFEARITDKTKAILLCNPNNPTGYVYTETEIKLLGDLCIKHNLFLIVDEAYRELTYDTKPTTALKTLAHLKENVIVLDTVSKQFSATGARVGFIVTYNQQVLKNTLKLAHMRLSPPYIDQLGAQALLQLPHNYYEEMRLVYKTRRNIVLAALRNMKGVICTEPNGAFYIVCQLPIEDAFHFCKWLLTDFRKHNKTIMLTPMRGFYQDSSRSKNKVRIAYVLNEDDLQDAMLCLNLALKDYQRLYG